jgi:chromosome segregation ATPase
MLNENLFTSQELEILKLKARIEYLQKQIKAFKQYDEERKEYYKNAMQELGELQSFKFEFEDSHPMIKELKDLVKKLTNDFNSIKCENRTLRYKVECFKIQDDFDPTPQDVQIARLKEANKKLEEQVKKQKQTINELIYKVVSAN